MALTLDEEDRARHTTVHILWHWTMEQDPAFDVDVTRSALVALFVSADDAASERTRRGSKFFDVTGPANLFALVHCQFIQPAPASELLGRLAAGSREPVILENAGDHRWNTPQSYDGYLTSPPLSAEEIRRAAAFQIWLVYYEDRFHLGPARECYPVAACFTREEAEAELKRRGSPVEPGGDGYSVEGPAPLAREDQPVPSIGADTVREVLRRIEAHEPGPVPVPWKT
jgi:hypothetical protein